MPRTALIFSDNVKLIELKETQKLSTKELINRFKCGKTQVYDAIKNKEKTMDEWVNSKNSGKSIRVKTSSF
jgi:predicted DNA-binding protein YlxM (UPF0122 family)